MIKRIFFLFVVFLSFHLFAKEPDWKSVEAKKVKKVLEKISWSKIQKSLTGKYEFHSSKDFDYSGCAPEFPDLPGGFPCTFLSDEFSDEGGAPFALDASGGRVEVKISKKNSLMGGKVFYVSEEEGKDKKEFLMKIFYSTDKYISHYTYKENLIFFKWSGKGNEKSLISVYKFQLDKEMNPISVQRIDF